VVLLFIDVLVRCVSYHQDVMCEFRAGKMSLEGTRVVPDTRKGLVRIGRVCMLPVVLISSAFLLI
jgi:hypothetical protein